MQDANVAPLGCYQPDVRSTFAGTVLGFQTFSLRDAAPEDDINRRAAALRQRPAVEEVFNRVAHRLELPLSERFWGGL